MEITARRLGRAPGGPVESALAPGINALKTFDPPLQALEGRAFTGVRRRGKLLLSTSTLGDLVLLLHLMSAGRLQLLPKRASLKDKTSRLLVRLAGGAGAAAARVRHAPAGVGEAAARGGGRRRRGARGPRARGVARPAGRCASCSTSRARCTPSCATSRSSPASAAPGWTRSSTWRACRPSSAETTCPTPRPTRCARRWSASWPASSTTTRRSVKLPLPEKFPKPTRVHAHQGEPCPHCETVLEAVFYEDYVMTYCPHCQTEGRVLKDRRLSRLLK